MVDTIQVIASLLKEVWYQCDDKTDTKLRTPLKTFTTYLLFYDSVHADICNSYFKIHITILTCEYHNSTKPNLRKGDSKNQPPKYPNLVVGSWAISR